MDGFEKFAKKNFNKKEILQHWVNLPSTNVIPVTPEPHDHYGSSLDEDTIRITGSKEFIDAVLARLKEMLQFESKDTELKLRYQESEYQHAGGTSPNYKFYCSVRYKDPMKKFQKGLFIDLTIDLLFTRGKMANRWLDRRKEKQKARVSQWWYAPSDWYTSTPNGSSKLVYPLPYDNEDEDEEDDYDD